MSNFQDFYDLGWKHALQQVQQTLNLDTDQIIQIEKLYK